MKLKHTGKYPLNMTLVEEASLLEFHAILLCDVYRCVHACLAGYSKREGWKEMEKGE